MKRSVLASLLTTALLLPAGPALASTTTYGSAKLQWTTAPTATMAIVTQYSTTFTQGNATPTLLPSAAGVCAGTGVESNFTLSYGTLTPKSNASTGCLYKNALAVSIQTNDGQGYTINQYLDGAPIAGIGVCAWPNGGASFPIAPAAAPVVASARAGNPAAGTYTGNALSSCAAGASQVPNGVGGVSAGGTTPGNPGTPSLEFYSPSTAALALTSSSVSTSNGTVLQTLYAAEDLQLNLMPGQVSTAAQSTYLTIQLVLN